jgi:predicted ferric reductase
LNRIRYALVIVICLSALLWLLADTLLLLPLAYFPFRAAFIQFSGTLAIAMMSVAVLGRCGHTGASRTGTVSPVFIDDLG